MKTKTITLSVKDPDAFDALRNKRGASKYLEFGEYARIELEVGDDFEIVNARFVPKKGWGGCSE